MARKTRALLVLAVVAVMTLILTAAPASATIHELVASFCSGQHVQDPPGVTGRSSADNFAQPLFATGVVQGLAPYDADGDSVPEAVIVVFDFDHPAMKFAAGGGDPVEFAPGFFVPELVADHPAFDHCPNFGSH